MGFHALHGLDAADAGATPGVFDGLAHMRKHIGLRRAADQLVLEAQAGIAVAPAGDVRQLGQAAAAALGVGPGEAGRGQHHGAGAIGDLAAVLASGARLDHRVGLVVVGKAEGVKGPLAGLGQRVAPGVAVVELGDPVQVFAVQPVAPLVLLRQQAKGRRPHEGAINVLMALPGGSVLVLRRHIARQVLELLHPQHQHAVVAAGFDFGHRAQDAQRRRGTGPFVPHGGHAPQLGHHLGHHRAQMGLLALQFTKGVADMDAGDGRGIQLAGRQGAERGLTCDVRNILALAGPDFGEIGLVTTQHIDGFMHVGLLLPARAVV